MRKARLFRLIIRVFLLIFTVSLSIVSALAGISAINIVTNQDNISIGVDNIESDLTDPDPSNWYVFVPFNITNDGYFDLNYFTLTLSIDMYYNTSYAFSTTIITASIIEPNPILKGTTYSGALNATDFTVPEFAASPIPYFLADLSLSGSYSFNLISFRAVIQDFNITI